MVRKYDELSTKERHQMYDGEGTVLLHQLLAGPEELNGKGRLYSTLTLPVGGCIGYHVHQGEDETFFVLKGCGEFNDNNEQTHSVAVGDVLHTTTGQGHSLKNTGREPLEVLALILYA